jgi:hypothetical protein
MANIPTWFSMKKTKSNVIVPKKEAAVFEKKPVFGVDRFYPKNEIAEKLVDFKRVSTQQNRKRFIKCLAQREIEVAQEMGIIIEIM